jgi:serine/threonine-protein kinase PpkA
MKIPGYTILRKLGAGGMATVYLARQERLARQVALKVLEPGSTNDQSFTARFIRESRIVARLQHPGIVTIYDFDSHGAYHYFSMEFLQGGTLEERIEAGLSIEQGLSILAEVADALDYAHAEGIIHRDIKPQNILFRADGTPVLSDFGIARVGEDQAATKLTRVDVMIGSPRYMSPEQIMGRPLDARSDLYGLGILCYELITGSTPFSAADVMTLAMQHCTQPLPTLPSHLCRFQPFLERITAKLPEQRFTSAGEAAAALREFIGSPPQDKGTERTRIVAPRPQVQPRTLPPAPPSTHAGSTQPRTGTTAAPPAVAGAIEGSVSVPPQPKPRRRQALVSLAAAALVLVMTAAGTAYYLFRQPPPGQAILAGLPAPAPERPRSAANFEFLAAEDFARGRILRSLELIGLGLEATPGDARLLALRARIETRRDVEQMHEAARTRAAQGDAQGALALVEKGLQELPNDPRLRNLQDDLRASIAGERQRRARALADAARKLNDEGKHDAALERVDAALGIAADDADLSILRASIEAARAREQRVGASLEQARQHRANDDLPGALAVVEAALAADPDDRRLTDLHEELSAEIAASRNRQVADLLRRGRVLLEEERFEQGIAVVKQALEAQPGQPDLLSLQEQLQDAMGRRRELETLLAQAGSLRDKQQFDEALTLIEQAAELAPDAVAVLQLREQLAEDRARALAQAERADACRATLAGLAAPTAEAVGRARGCWEELRQAHPDDADAAAALASLEARLPAWIALQLERDAPAEARRLADQLALLDAQTPALAELRQAIDAAELRLSLMPDMIPLEGACFRMGSPPSEPRREPDERAHSVCVEDFEIGRHEVTVAEFRRFVEAADYRTDAERDTGGLDGCWSLHGGEHAETAWRHLDDASWLSPLPGAPAAGSEPVSCVSWYDAIAYIEWLNHATGENFRLPTEAEWEYAARAGTQTARYWGDTDGAEVCRNANVADAGSNWTDGFACDDGAEWAAEVGSFARNPWGLHDILGNLWEWTCSTYDAAYGGAETRCVEAADDSPRVLRGGSWYSGPQPIRAAVRNRAFPEARYSFLGFRLARGQPLASASDATD